MHSFYSLQLKMYLNEHVHACWHSDVQSFAGQLVWKAGWMVGAQTGGWVEAAGV